ncbi:MAG TPA: efflux RND transporter permease subunit [Fibrobacteraceae bacterium]|nr:efflux RND transporter permease subunit [Fibrobacteraceae bacterium]
MENEDHRGPIAWAMQNRQVVLALVAILLGYGVYALLHMPRQEFPEFKVRQGLVVGVYPGGTSEEVEERLTKKVESYLFGFKEIDRKKTWSVSRQGRMYIYVEIAPEVKEPDLFWPKVRLGLNELKSAELPPQVLALQVVTEFGDVSAIILSLSGNGKSYDELGKDLDRLEDQLRKVEAVSKVRAYGKQPERILVRFQKDRLAAFHLQPASILAALKLDAGMTTAGTLHQGDLELPIYLPPAFSSEQDLANAIVFADPVNGHVVRLRDVAEIVRDHGRMDSYVETDGERSLLVSLEMKQGNNIVAFGKEIEKVVDQFNMEKKGHVQVVRVVNQPEVVNTSVTHFLRDFLISIVAVILVTMLLLPLRVASVAALTIPISILITLGVMQVLGMDLNTVTLASLILVLGMVVDNAIIVIDDHVERLDQGESIWHAALRSSATLFAPVFSATFAIIMVFFPLMFFMTGTFKDFIGGLPITVAIALGVSLAVSTFLVPVLNLLLIRHGLGTQGPGRKKSFSMLDLMQGTYGHVVNWIFHHPVYAVFIGIASIGLALCMAPHVKQQLFPKLGRNQFAVEITLPEGRSLEETGRVAKFMTQDLRKSPWVRSVSTFVGSSSPRFHASYAPAMPAPNFAQLLVTTTSEKTSDSVIALWQSKPNPFPDARIRYKEITLTPNKSPIEVRVIGDSLPLLHEVGDQIMSLYRKLSESSWVENDFQEKVPLVQVNRDPAISAYAGITRDLLGSSLALATGNLPVATLWEGDVPVSIEFAGEAEGHLDAGNVGNVLVSAPASQTMIPLRQIAQTAPVWGEGQILHRNGMRTMTVRTDMRAGVIAKPVWLRLREQILKLPLPQGVRLEFAGEEEAEGENYGLLTKSLILGVFSIFIILLFQFRSIPYTLLIMGSMPLSLFGAVLGLLLTGYPFGFTAFVGVISLFGMVVRNGIIMIRYGEELRSNGMDVKEAAMAAGKRRMRPIFLTSAAAAIGVIPMITSGSTLWGPLGAVTCFGLIFSTIFTLIVLPVLYWGVAKHTVRPEAHHE